MIEYLSSMIKGHITIKDAETGEVIVDKDNAVHFGNISTEIAQALIGDKNSFITYMVFGNGGVIIDSAGNIVYRKPNTSINKNETAQLYNSTLVQKLSNSATNITDGSDPMVTVPGGNTKNFEDIQSVVLLESGFPNTQQNIDNASGSNDQVDSDETTFVFNEIALYTGPEDLGTQIETQGIQTFISDPDSILITHVIFHPVQKSLNRTLEITYTLRIQMGE